MAETTETKAKSERKSPKEDRAERAPSGYYARRACVMATLGGTIRVEANRPIRDMAIIGHLQRAGVALDPFWD